MKILDLQGILECQKPTEIKNEVMINKLIYLCIHPLGFYIPIIPDIQNYKEYKNK